MGLTVVTRAHCVVARCATAFGAVAGGARVGAVYAGAGRALVVMPVVLSVGMAVVEVVHVVLMNDSGMTAIGTVSVVVALREQVCCGHFRTP